jgi:hypothetical protein
LEGAVDLLTLRTETRPRVQPFGLERVVQKPFKLAATVGFCAGVAFAGRSTSSLYRRVRSESPTTVAKDAHSQR